MYILIIASTLDDAIAACDKARAIINGVHAIDKRLQIRVGINDEYDNLMAVRCPECTVIRTGHYTGSEVGERFRIAHAACHAWYEDEIIVLDGAAENDAALKNYFWDAIEALRTANRNVVIGELA